MQFPTFIFPTFRVNQIFVVHDWGISRAVVKSVFVVFAVTAVPQLHWSVLFTFDIKNYDDDGLENF